MRRLTEAIKQRTPLPPKFKVGACASNRSDAKTRNARCQHCIQGGGHAKVLLNCFRHVRLARWLGDVLETHRTCGTHLELVLELTAHIRGPRGRRCRAVRQVRAASTSARCTQCAHHRGQRSRRLARSARCAQWPMSARSPGAPVSEGHGAAAVARSARSLAGGVPRWPVVPCRQNP